MPAVTRQISSLAEARREFLRHTSPRWLLGAIGVLALLRARQGFGYGDLVVVAALVAAQPFVEWVVHAFVLHCPADGRWLDRYFGWTHRKHHEDPRDLRWQFLDARVPQAFLGLGLLSALAGRQWLTGMLAATVLLGVYEWVHFLIHTDHAPRGRLFRGVHRAHRLHHFRNEHYWLGVSRRAGDRVLRTNPRKEDVEVSPTAKTALARR